MSHKEIINPNKTAISSISQQSLEKIETFRGLYILGHEVRSFTPCGSDKEYWVLDKTDGKIIDIHRKLTHKPYSPIFVEVQGELSKSPQDGFGEDYDKTLIIRELTHASSANEGWGCREKYEEFAFKAQGNEPGWTILITEDQLHFSSINHEKPLMFPLSTPLKQETNIIYESVADKHTASITLIPTQCTNTMSGEVFGWSAKAEVDGKTYRGCAKKGDL